MSGIDYQRCDVPRGAQPGTWWKYSLQTRSGINRATGFRQGSETEVKQALNKLLQRMELAENPYGARWAEFKVRPARTVTNAL